MTWAETSAIPFITLDFLNSVLRSVIGTGQATITDVRQEQLTGSHSFNANLIRLILTYDRPITTEPKSLIAKLPTIDADLHERAAIFQPGLREAWFYRSAAARSPVQVPRCYHQAGDRSTGQSILLLEDLAPAPPGNWLEGATLQQARLALESLARLHACWWADASSKEIQELTALLSEIRPAEQNLVQDLFASAWTQFLKQRTVAIPEEVRSFGAALVGNLQVIDALIDLAPKTLIHGDYRLDNMHFGSAEGKPVCWVIDWEDVHYGSGMVDVSWFLSGCLPVEESHHETNLLRFYYQTLAAEGVEDYSWAQCYQHYRCGMCSSFVQGILSATLDDGANERDYRLARVVGQRFIAAVSRLRLLELLPS